jgi:hypothetical protein
MPAEKIEQLLAEKAASNPRAEAEGLKENLLLKSG